MHPNQRTARCSRISTAICLLVLGVVTHGILFAQTTKVIGYYPMWNRDTYPPSKIQFHSLNIIAHAFAWPLANGSLGAEVSAPDTELTGVAHRAGCKIVISLGGATESGAFSSVAADTTLRRKFISNVVAYIQSGNYDGADLDWESPSSTADKANEVVLTREMRQAFDGIDTSWTLSMAVGVSDWSGQWHNYDSLAKYVDWFGAMTYDFHGSWSSHVGHVAPLYAPSSDVNDYSVDQGMTYLHTTRKIPASQLVVGLPFYGREWHASALYSTFSSVTDLLYSEVPAKLADGWTYHWDSVSDVPYLTNPADTLIDTYDDSTSLAMKCAYSKAKGYAGVMIWALGEDLVSGEQPMLTVVGNAMLGTTGVDEQHSALSPRDRILLETYPNPFNPSTTIRFTIPSAAHVNLAVFDNLGRRVAVLADGTMTNGQHAVQWQAGSHASGVYYARLLGETSAGVFSRVSPVLLVK